MTDYKILLKQASEIIEGEPWCIAALSNISSLIMTSLKDLNWAGFYLVRNGVLTVGPFQGKPACIHIQPGKGVCGTALLKDETMLVPDVHAFSGHIACDSASNSEIVVPIHSNGRVVAVLDIDSPLLNRFSEADKAGLGQLARLLEEKAEWEINNSR
ncbi:GAF domain-containing protein [bacterium]|nr:GAF domain-containing protein [bacterium]